MPTPLQRSLQGKSSSHAPADIQKVTSKWPAEQRARFTYVKYDLEGITYRKFQNVTRDYLGCKATNLSTVAVSTPCQTYTTAHHGKSPHRYKLRPISETARLHDRLLYSIFDVLRQFSHHAYKTVITAENPLCDFRRMPIIQRLLPTLGWIERTADHCMHWREGEDIFPRKRSTWLLFNVYKKVPTKKCAGTCGCTVKGTRHHQKLRARTYLTVTVAYGTCTMPIWLTAMCPQTLIVCGGCVGIRQCEKPRQSSLFRLC